MKGTASRVMKSIHCSWRRMRQCGSPPLSDQVSPSMVSMEKTIARPESIQGAQASVMWKFSKS